MSLVVHLCLVLAAVELARPQVIVDWIPEIDKIGDKAELDGDWRKYVESLGAGQYDEAQYAEGDVTERTEWPRARPRPLRSWRPVSHEEVPFLAVLYVRDDPAAHKDGRGGPSQVYKTFFKGEPDPGWSHIEPGTACGGALLSPKHVLTSCGCLYPFVAFTIYHLFKPYEYTVPPYQLKEYFESPGAAPTVVYVAIGSGRFAPKAQAILSQKLQSWPVSDLLNCGAFIKKNKWTKDRGPVLEHMAKVNMANGQLMVAPIIVQESGLPFSGFSTWPPHVINMKTDPAHRQKATVVSIGMGVTEVTSVQFYSSIDVSSLELNHCSESVNSTSCGRDVWDTAWTSLDVDHVCFCPVAEKDRARPQLIGGTIGWPVLNRKGELIGLTATNRRPEDGTIVVAMIPAKLVPLIEDYVGKEVLQDQNRTEGLVYREKQLAEDALLYDYMGDIFRKYRNTHFADIGQIDTKSQATHIRCMFLHVLLSFFGTFLWI